jgi:septal ring factor EnvC (AmiA/AmiB activator)
MKKTIVLFLVLCNGITAFSQCKELIEEIKNQQTTIDSLRDDSNRKANEYTAGLSKLQEQIKALEKEKDDFNKKIKDSEKEKDNLNKKIKDLEKDIANLNKNKVKIENDNLQKQVDRLTTNVTELTQRISEKDKQIAEAKQNGEQKAKEEKVKGKNETLANILNSYKNRKFDDLIRSSTKLSVQHDMLLAGNNEEVKPALSDLVSYFNAEELLATKFDAAKIQNAQTQLSQINRQSALLDKLKENIEYYKDFNDELKKTVEKLIDLDSRKSASETELQKQKFNDIVIELSGYMYDYYDYGNYPYLSGIVLEIIKRKKPDADADITDLLKKLQ